MVRSAKMLLSLSLILIPALAAGQVPQGSAFSYQGRLDHEGSPLDGLVDLEFTLWDAASAGTMIGVAFGVDSVTVADGLFSVQIDFGPGAFDGEARWLEIGVRSPHDPGDSEPFVLLDPRQALSAAPYAQHALNGGDQHWVLNGSALTNSNGGFVGINRDYPVGSEFFGVHAPVSSGYGGMYVSTEAGTSKPFYGYHSGNEVGWHYLDADDGDWHLNLNNSDRMTVTDEGQVGIGIPDPTEKLQVGGTVHSTAGGFKFPDGTVQSTAAVSGGGDGHSLDAADGDPFDVVYVDAAGITTVANFLGVGRSGPVSSSEVFGIFSPTSNGYGGMYALTDGPTSKPFYGYHTGTESAWTYLNGADRSWRVNIGGDRLALTPSSNLGIATMDPQARLHAVGGTDVNTVDGGYLILGNLGGTNIGIDNNEIMARNNGVAANLSLNADGGNILLNGSASASVGIGTTSPRAELEIDGGLLLGGTGRDVSWATGEVLQIGAYNGTTFDHAASFSWTANAGRLTMYGGSGSGNVYLTRENANDDHGWIDVSDASSNPQAGIYVNSSGNGIVWGDTKNFRMDNPRDAATEIVYACVEGPEAAAYLRGTGQLVNGRAVVDFPEHFRDVIVAAGMTVQLTPRDASSEGLAVVDRSLSGFEVAELRSGRGSYAFDWEVKGVRAGYEDYEVIRSKSQDIRYGSLEAEGQ